jgi:hypothetical protein
MTGCVLRRAETNDEDCLDRVAAQHFLSKDAPIPPIW